MAPGPVERDSLDARILDDDALQQDAENDYFEPQAPITELSLPPVDTGKDAWLFLAACWAIEALTYGFGFSFGVFQDFYSNHEPFAGSRNIPIIGTTTTGVLYLGTPFVLALCRLFPRWARWFTLTGLIVASLSMALSSFCDNVPQLIGTQGILFSIGGCFAQSPCVLYIEEWFVKRKGMAYGIMWSAAGFGGVVIPTILESLLNNLGFRTATRIWAGVLFAIAAPLAFFVKPRLPYSPHTHPTPFNMRFVKSKLFALYQVANIIQAAGFFLPGIYLPTYARKVYGASNFLSALTLILVNLAATIGLTIMGSLTDKVHVTTCIIISAVGAATSVLLIWGLSASLPVLYVFCVFYGLFAGSWPSIWPGVMKEIAERSESDGYGYVDPLMVYSHLSIGRGVGNVISGPLSETLIQGRPWLGQAIGGYGSGYGGLIIFSGLTALVSGMSFLLRYLGLL